MQRHYPSLLVAAFLLTVCDAASAQDWTRFRGPNGAGQCDAADIPVEWTDKDYNWKVTLPGKGHSSPVLWGEKLFILSANPDTAEKFVLCLSTKDGAVLWQKSFPSKKTFVHEQNSQASSTPAVDKDHVYVTWASTDLITVMAFDHDGKEVWKREDLGGYQSQNGFGTSPIVYEDMVIMTDHSDGRTNFLFAFNCADGKTRWQVNYRRSTADQNACYSAPTVYTPRGGEPELIVSSWGQGITSFDPKTGKPLWEAKNVFPQRTVGSPIVIDDIILGTCGQSSGANYMFAYHAGDRDGKTPTLAYKLDKNSSNPYVVTPVLAGKLVFLWGDSGILTVLQGDTGKQEYKERLGGNYFGSPIRIGERIYCMSSEGQMVVVAATNQFKVLSRVPLGESTHATPAVSNGVMYLRTESHLMSLGGKK